MAVTQPAHSAREVSKVGVAIYTTTSFLFSYMSDELSLQLYVELTLSSAICRMNWVVEVDTGQKQYHPSESCFSVVGILVSSVCPAWVGWLKRMRFP